jgi:glutaconate CoA-transferase subunit B
MIIMRQNPRAFVGKLDFLTTLGHGVTGRERRAMGLTTEGPVRVITDLCVMTPDEETKELMVTSLHPGTTREQVRQATGWEIRFADAVGETERPTAVELEALRDLNARTARAHGTTAGE